MAAEDLAKGNEILENDESFKEMMSLFNEKTYFQRLKGMFEGFKAPKDSKEYKMARIEMQRQAAPLAAVLIPVILVALLAVLAKGKEKVENTFETDIVEVEEIQEQLEDIPQDTPEPQPMDDIMPNDVQFTPDMAMDIAAPAPDAPVSAQPQSVDAVAVVKSPVILRNIFGSTRNTGMRGAALKSYGGNAKTEASVIRSLRWLKAVQNADGSWPNNKVAMTGLTILTFLAHGEKPGDSPEFGETVQKAMEFLISQQNSAGLFTTAGSGYAHAIATYAMCEAYGMTMNPNVKAAADKGLEVVINGQHPSGGWDYNWKQSDRDDTSVMGWCAQSLKAGIMANFYHDPEALDRASRLCVKGFKKNGVAEGGFGYTSPQKGGGLTGVGTLCMQFHHAAGDSFVKNSLQNVIYTWKPEWIGYSPERAARGEKLDKPKELPPGAVGGACPQYYYYYGTQAVFQGGGDQWKKWNERMWPSYVAAQFVIPKGEAGASYCTCKAAGSNCLCTRLKEPYVDHEGNQQELGHWVNTDAHTDRPIMDTCLAALQMMVYYRYLPTFKQVDVPAEVVGDTTDSGDIEVTTDL